MTILGVGPFELLIILIIALVVVGPERLPELMRMAGSAVRRMRQMSDQIRQQARSELGEDYDYIQQQVRVLRDLNPRRQIQELATSLLDEASGETAAPPPTTPPPAAIPRVSAAKREIMDLASQSLSDDMLDQQLSEDLSTDQLIG